MNEITKKELREYDKQVKKRAKKFKLKSEDAHNLYDLYFMSDKNLHKTLRINKMDKWFYNFTRRIERIVQSQNIAFDKKKN